jgi:hypothetical protein
LPDDSESPTIDVMSELDPLPATESLEAPGLTGQLQVTQFGIIHLMIWTTLTAVLLKVFMALTGDSIRQFAPGQQWLFQGLQAVQTILLACTLVATGILVRKRFYAMPKKLQPGHWLVLFSTMEFALQMLVLLALWVSGFLTLRIIPLSSIVSAVFITAVAAFYGFAFFQLRDARRWKVMIGAKALGAATGAAFGLLSVVVAFVGLRPQYSALLGWLRYCPLLWPAVIFVLLLAAAALDIYHRTTRDWVHWLGVCVFGLTTAVTLAADVYFMFFFQLPR